MHQEILISNTSLNFMRDELDGALLIIPHGCSYNDSLIINSSGREILELCDGSRTISDVINSFIFQNPQIPSERITLDVLKYIDYLLKLNLLLFKERNQRMYEPKIIYTFKNYNIHRCGERNYKRIQSILQQERILDLHNSSLTDEDYKPIVLRARLFNYAEEFYILESDGIDIAVLSILTGRMLLNKTATLGRLLVTVNVNEVELTEFIKKSLDNYIMEIEPDCYRVRLSIIGELTEATNRILIKAGFNIKATLKDEFGINKNQILIDYNRFLPEKFSNLSTKIAQ